MKAYETVSFYREGVTITGTHHEYFNFNDSDVPLHNLSPISAQAVIVVSSNSSTTDTSIAWYLTHYDKDGNNLFGSASVPSSGSTTIPAGGTAHYSMIVPSYGSVITPLAGNKGWTIKFSGTSGGSITADIYFRLLCV